MSHVFVSRVGSGGAFRVDSDRVFRDGVQAEPDALGARLLACPAPHGTAPECSWDGICAVVRAHAGRQRESARDAARGIPHSRHHPHDAAERDRGARRVPARDRPAHSAGAPVHGDGEHHHGARQEGRRSAGGTREDKGVSSFSLSCVFVLDCCALRTNALQVLSHEAAYQVKQLGEENDLIARVRKDAYFDPIKDELDALLDPRSFIGRAPQQVDKFVNDWVVPALAAPELKAAVDIGDKAELSV
jgi:hypothetical protein